MLSPKSLIGCKPLPPCPKGVDFRSSSEWVPGRNCQLVEDEPEVPPPFCEDEDTAKPLTVRGFEDCIPHPPCPPGVDFRSSSEWVPGKTCKLIPTQTKAEEPAPAPPANTRLVAEPTQKPAPPARPVPASTTPESIIGRDDFIFGNEPEPVSDLPPKERWRLSATPDQIKLVESAREKGTARLIKEFILTTITKTNKAECT